MKIYYDLNGTWAKEVFVSHFHLHLITIEGDISDWEVSELVACLIKPENKCFREINVISKGASHG